MAEGRKLLFVDNRPPAFGMANQQELYDRFGHGQYAYTLFMKLMNKLESEVVDEGKEKSFWYNRQDFLRFGQYLVIVLDDATDEIVAFYVAVDHKESERTEIRYIQVFEPRQGIGRQCIDHIIYNFASFDKIYASDIFPDSEEFWQKMDIAYELDGIMYGVE